MRVAARWRARGSASVLLCAVTLISACSTVSLDAPPTVSVARQVPVQPIAAPPLPASSSSGAVRGAPQAASAPSPASALAAGMAQTESPGVAARFPDTPVAYQTPAFSSGHAGFTSNAELHATLVSLRREAERGSSVASVRLIDLGLSQMGAPLEALRFTHDDLNDPGAHTAKPTVLLVGGQHGDEPAATEALIVIAQELAHGQLAALLDRIDVVILPRANPDGAASGQRLSASGIDVNRDHLLLRTPEAQAQARLVRDYEPVVVVDLHEYPAFGHFAEKFGALPRADAMIQYATVANLPSFVTRAAEEWFRQPLLRALGAEGLTSDWFHTTSADPSDRKVSMGGVQADSSRNVNGLRNAVSLLIETRGKGLGPVHLQRRVYTQVTAIASILQSAASRADDLEKLRHFTDRDVAAEACQGDIVVDAAPTASEYNLAMLDPLTGADKTVSVNWDSALALTPLVRRTRPCGYWLDQDQRDAVLRLRSLGVVVQRIERDGELRGEGYTESGRTAVPLGTSAQSNVAEPGGPVRVQVQLLPALLDVRSGGYYIGLDQPLANLVIAALEPDSPASFVSHHIIDSVASEARILQPSDLETSVVP